MARAMLLIALCGGVDILHGARLNCKALTGTRDETACSCTILYNSSMDALIAF